MFVPLTVLIQSEDQLRSPEDVIKALDRWVLPKYPDFMTQNPAFTKVECMGVLNSFQAAGKLHVRLKPVEVHKAVNAFLEERLWVDKPTLDTIELLPNQLPEGWMIRPTLFKTLMLIPRVLIEATQVILNLIKTGILYTFYSFTAERNFTMPKGPTLERKFNLTKKDN